MAKKERTVEEWIERLTEYSSRLKSPNVGTPTTPWTQMREAARALAAFGPAAKPAISALLAALDRDRWNATPYAQAFLGIGAGSREAVELLLKGEHPFNFNHTLGEFGNEAAFAIPRLLKSLKAEDRDEYHRVDIVMAFGLIGSSAAQAVPAIAKELLAGLGDSTEESGLRRHVMALGDIGDQRGLEPVREALKRGEHPGMRECAADALGKFGPRAAAAVPDLIERLENKTEGPSVRSAACRALAAIGAEAEPALPAITASVKHRSPEVREAAAAALKTIKTARSPALPRQAEEKLSGLEPALGKKRRRS